MTTARISVDVGGTFTDVVLLTQTDLVTVKVPSTDDQSSGVIDGIEKACEEAEIDPADITEFTHGMTVSINALLEGDGAKTALITTDGFRDVLEIGRQDRPDLYDLTETKVDPLVPRRRRFEIDERATVDGIQRSPDDAEIQECIDRLASDNIESVAISLLHAYRFPENERSMASRLREELDVPVSASHEVLSEFREYERTSTTVADAYVTPVIDAYLERLEQHARDLDIPAPRIMQANGGIAAAETVRKRAITSVMSGPAAGVIGAAETAESFAEDLAGLVTFDMGGTSSDVSLVRDGEVEQTTDGTIDRHPIQIPMVDVTTVGAGGGSIAWADAGGALRVGPQSAGATPGPACYGQGGMNPTVTDANVVLGYIGEDSALGGELSLDTDAARAVLTDLAETAGLSDALAAARGVYRIANANMTRAIRTVTVERGYDPRQFGLVAFGGAGPMHGARLADRLDIERVIVPRACGVLSAYGLLAADEKYDAAQTVRSPLDDIDLASVEHEFESLQEEVLAGVTDDTATVERAADLRYTGQSFELTVPVGESFDPERIESRFHRAYETAYGYRLDDPVELVTLRTTAVVERDSLEVSYQSSDDARKGTREAFFGEQFHETPVYARESLPPGRDIHGPSIVEQHESTVVVPPEWTGTVQPDGTIVLYQEGDNQ